MKVLRELVLSSIILLSGCADDDLPEYVELKGLRILALQAGSPGAAAEFSPGDNVTVTPYISDYLGGSQTLTYEAMACPDPGLRVGAEPSCEGVPGAASVGSGAAATPGVGRTGSTTSFGVSIPATLLTGRSAKDQYNGVSYLVTYTLTAANGQSVQSFKRIVVSDSAKTTKNLNPQTSGLLANGSALSTFPTSEVRLSVSYPASSIEGYDFKKEDLTIQSATEELLTTWFITDGEVEFYRTVNTDTTKFDPLGAAPVGRQPLVVGVTRDGRGGVTVTVQPL